MVRVLDIQQMMERWAPPGIAWEKDNIGLQCGDPRMLVRGILVGLDPTEGLVAEARKRRANLIVTHHPLLFRPLGSVTPATATGRSLASLLGSGIALLAAHTNLDFTRGGTSFALASVLGLEDVGFLEPLPGLEKKIVTFVPAEHADAVANAMAAAGAGTMGEYTHCSFRAGGIGTFFGMSESRPSVGRAGRLEQVPEIRLEMIAPSWAVPGVVHALKRAHPYEEVAFDTYSLENDSARYGMGVIGSLPRPIALGSFLRNAKRVLRARALRWTGAPAARVRRVAVCGGSGADLLERAVSAGADVFVTADVKYHSYHDARGRIALIDAGHFETEQPVVPVIVKRLRDELRQRESRIAVRAAMTIENPVRTV